MSPAPLPITLLTPADYRRVPWKNGLGLTTEIAVEESPDGSRFVWRVSIADVAAPGPFSAFPGYDRLIAVVEGTGMRLAVDGAAPVECRRPSPAFAFPGEAAVDCTLLDGPIRDFNLMLDRATAAGVLTLLGGGPGRAATCEASGDVILVHALAGSVTVVPDGQAAVAVPQGHSALLRGAAATTAATVAVPDGAEAVCAEVRRR